MHLAIKKKPYKAAAKLVAALIDEGCDCNAMAQESGETPLDTLFKNVHTSLEDDDTIYLLNLLIQKR